jgi:protein TonB
MSKDFGKIGNLDDIVFEGRNRNYGAFVLRKRYKNSVLISLLIGVIIISTAVITPYLNARALGQRKAHTERQVEIKMQNLDQPNEIVAPPPPPPPPDNVIQQVKYIPPVIVDSVKPEENVKIMTADEAQTKVTNNEVIEVSKEVKEEVQESETEHEPFLMVQEMPEPQGGISGLYKFIGENTQYPPIARDNNIQGKVFVRFCVTSKGTVDQVSIIKGVSPELDAEAIRVVKLFPTFRPGKQDGKPVPVWYNVSIIFKLQ